ncbi:MAG: iron dicitrate transport regulator FecR [Maribacter sp.]|nr:MAG: iron dicitrate transport regulator FecR [Maribacter sp.]
MKQPFPDCADKFFNNELSFEEVKELKKWMEHPKNKQFLKDEIQLYHLINAHCNTFDAHKAYMKKFPDGVETAKVKQLRFRALLKYAALFIGVLGLGYVFYSTVSDASEELIVPDENIVLQLENGDTQVIKENGTVKVMGDGGAVVAEQHGKQLSYTGQAASETLAYNELSIPYGKQFQLTLSDGTLVHLNAGSSLRYPVKFLEGKSREVFLVGEAFFDVAKDEAHPFIVNAMALNVEVIGTQFNVSSYPEDHSSQVVLVEGSVGLYTKDQNSSAEKVVLTPGHMGEWNKTKEEFSIQKVNINQYTSWRKGELMFRNSTFKQMLKTLERHYNVVILNKNKEVEEILFNASFKQEPIENILSYFDEVLGLEYSIEDNTIIIN